MEIVLSLAPTGSHDGGRAGHAVDQRAGRGAADGVEDVDRVGEHACLLLQRADLEVQKHTVLQSPPRDQGHLGVALMESGGTGTLAYTLSSKAETEPT